MHLADSQIVAQTAPIFSAAFARIFLKEPWHCSEFFSAGAGIAGVAFIAKPQVLLHPDEPEALAPGVAELGGVGPVHSRQLVGVFFGLLSAVAAGCAYVIIRFLGTGAKVHWASVLLAQASGQLALSPLGWRLSGQQLRLFTRSELVMNVAVGALGFFSQCAMTKGMQKEKSATASLVRQSLCPCFALLWQLCFFPEDRLGWTSLAGFATILLGLAVTVTCKAFREQRAAGETYGHLASEKNEDSPPASTDCCAVVAEAADAQAVYGKRSFFDEAPGETRERQMIHELQGDGFSQKQAELALAKVNWSSVQAARDVLLDVKYVLGQAPNGAVAGGNGAVSAAGTPGVAEKGQLRA
ncbi:unnamed protein product [Effrenium voratum]|nr:unnamed protein product [Effrenium voratum]